LRRRFDPEAIALPAIPRQQSVKTAKSARSRRLNCGFSQVLGKVELEIGFWKNHQLAMTIAGMRSRIKLYISTRRVPRSSKWRLAYFQENRLTALSLENMLGKATGACDILFT
jgi:hypothetical protein